MKAHYRTGNSRITFEVEGGSQKDLFEAIAEIQEVFEADAACGACGSGAIQYRVREVEGNKYYELHCLACRARLSYGQNKMGGTLFAKRKSKEGEWLPNRGWYKYSGKGDSE